MTVTSEDDGIGVLQNNWEGIVAFGVGTVLLCLDLTFT